jgi:DNA-binding NarL/FixJ family response regulator
MEMRFRPLSAEESIIMTNLDSIKARPRSQQILNLLVQGCSNKEIGVQLNMSARDAERFAVAYQGDHLACSPA